MLYRIVGLAAMLVCCAGCSLPGPIAPTALPGAAPDAGQFLYIGGTELSQYALGGSKPLHSVKIAYGTSAIAFDNSGNLFATSGGASEGDIQVYRARDLTLERTTALYDSTYLTVNRRGYLYASNCGDGINVFAPGAARHVYTQTVGSGACAMVMNRSSDLFVISGGYNSSSVKVFTALRSGHLRYLRSITDHVSEPVALAIGPDDELFVLNCPRCAYNEGPHPRRFVSVYASGKSVPERIVTGEISGPNALAVAADGTLYVASAPLGSKARRPKGWVTVYAPGATRPLRKITDGISEPTALALDASGKLYVADGGASSVTVYNAGGTKLLQKITDGVRVALTLGIH